jgi:hypothetical protein
MFVFVPTFQVGSATAAHLGLAMGVFGCLQGLVKVVSYLPRGLCDPWCSARRRAPNQAKSSIYNATAASAP